jgi:hypothetical protein
MGGCDVSEGNRRASRRFGGGPADKTVRFGFGGAEYEIDLSSKNASAFRKQLTPFIEPARRADGDWPAG